LTGKAVKSTVPVQDRDHYSTSAVFASASVEPAYTIVSDQRVLSSLLQEHASVHKAAGGSMSLAVLWGSIVAISFALAVSILYLCSAVGGQRNYEVKSNPARGSMRSAMSSRRSGSEACSGQDTFTEDESCMSSSTLQTRSRTSAGLPGLPLCHLLVVPDGTRLACFVQNEVRHRKQDLAFDVSAVPARGGAPLFRMRVSEMGPEPSKIFVETLGGREQLAELSTEELWRGTPNPSLAISRPWGLPYGQVQKGDNGEYLMLRSHNTMLVFSGDYKTHNIQVQDTSGHTIATTMQTSPDEYQVHMQARTDAGLVILALLAIDKCELAETPVHSSKALALRSEDALQNTTSQISAGHR
jgi:hypothetical protein